MMVIGMLLANSVFGSNVTITQVPELTTVGNLKEIKFGISWENSWRDTNNRWGLLYDRNWDAVWVFVKYRLSGSDWDHAYLDNTYTPTVGANNGVNMGYKYGTSNGKTVGVFLFRSQDGRGDVNWQDVKLAWRFKETNAYLGRYTVKDTDPMMVKIFAIEMVYIKQGPFYLGSGGDEDGGFRMAEDKRAFYVTSEDSIRLRAQNAADAVGALSCNAATTAQSAARNNIGVLGTLPAAFPKGFKGFYCMKYEITQGAYVDFLNTLNAWQQRMRTFTHHQYTPNRTDPKLYAKRLNSANERNGIQLNKSPYKYVCNLNNNDISNENEDGAAVVCAMNQDDFLSYLDFCGLRPMTEMEFEKVCRGSGEPTPGEFAWNSTVFQTGSQFDLGTEGTPEEHPLISGVNHLGAAWNLITRNGAFVVDGYGRQPAGSARTGVMEMSNNLWEYCVNVITLTARAYTGNHGDGRISPRGYANVEAWPCSTGLSQGNPWNRFEALGIRGGDAGNAITANGYHTISNRYNAYWTTTSSVSWNVGGRGVRTAE